MNVQGRRIADIQRRLRQIGRIRTGYSTPTTSKAGKAFNRPERSETFILSSLQKPMIEAAAQRWGGTVEPWTPQGTNVPVWRVVTDASEIDAILPPGDPLSTMYELWKAGECIRRCDGVSEDKSGQACLCKAQFGDLWYEQEPTVPPKVCKITGRLNVFLELGDDFGYWRTDVHSFHAVAEWDGFVELKRGFLGDGPAIRIRMAIEQRPDGKTTFPVVALKMRDELARMILSGITPSLELEGGGQSAVGGRQVPALTATPAATAPPAVSAPAAAVAQAGPVDWVALFNAATELEELRERWRECARAGALTEELKARWQAARAKLAQPAPPPATAVPVDEEPPPDDDPPSGGAPIDAEVEPDRNAVWMQICLEGGKRKMDTATLSRLMREHPAGPQVDPTHATGFQMAAFLAVLEKGDLQ